MKFRQSRLTVCIIICTIENFACFALHNVPDSLGFYVQNQMQLQKTELQVVKT